MVAEPTLGGRWAVERTRPRHRWKASRRRPGHAAGRRSTCQPKTLPGPGCLCPYCWTRPANSTWPRPPRGGAMLCSARIGGAGSRSCAARPLSRWTRPAQPYHCTRLWMRGPCNGGPTRRLKACGATRLAASRYLWRAARPRMATCWRPSRKRCCSCTAEPASLRRLQERRTLQVREPTSPAECRTLDQRRWRPGRCGGCSGGPACRPTPPQTPAPQEARRGRSRRAGSAGKRSRPPGPTERRRAARPFPSHARGRLGARVAQESLHAAVASRPNPRCPEGRADRRPDRGTARPELSGRLEALPPRPAHVAISRAWGNARATRGAGQAGRAARRGAVPRPT